jgi:polyhydroxyalkanoate synthesis regulator phasin
MSDEKSGVADKASEIARNIWLAGVGAYGKAVDDAQSRLEKAGVEPPKLFKELVKAGAALEEEARETMSSRKSGSSSVEERINKVRENFSLGRYVRGNDIESLHRKIDDLAGQVEALNAALKAAGLVKPKAKTRRKSAAAKKPASKAKAKAKTRSG